MNKIIFYLFLAFIICTGVAGCEKMDSTYKGFLVTGGITYPQKAVSPMAYSGRNRVKISWLRGKDPNVVKARIFWDSYTDSIEVVIPPAGDTISRIIDNLPEKSYTFIIKTYDSKGNISIPVEMLSTSYGQKYQDRLLQRPITQIQSDATGTTITWGAANISGGAYATEITYTDKSDKSMRMIDPADYAKSRIIDAKSGSSFQVRTLYIPDELSIDTFYTDFKIYSP